MSKQIQNPTNKPGAVLAKNTGVKNGMNLNVEVTGYAANGFGTCTVNGVTVHIPDSAPGDRVSIRIDHISRQAPNAWARIVAPPERGDKWKRHFCSFSESAGGRCGGCPLGNVAKDLYRSVKLGFIADAFAESGITNVPTEIVLGNMKRYRNKSNFVVHKQKNGKIQLGSWALGSHRFAAMDNCLINSRNISTVQRDIQTLLTNKNVDKAVPVYPMDGGIRYITVKSFDSGATLLDIVINADTVSNVLDIVGEMATHTQIHGVSISCNSGSGNQLRTESASDTIGRGALCEQIGDIKLWMKATTFFQLNNDVARQMYQLAAQWCADANIIWDLYCGIGGLGLTISSGGDGALYGCDCVTDSISLAKRNAEENGITASFAVLDLSQAFPEKWPRPDVVLINPPRRGIDACVLEKLGGIKPAQIIYMSCNPATFARDAAMLKRYGYHLGDIAAFDMLPNTSHVELLGRFNLRE